MSRHAVVVLARGNLRNDKESKRQSRVAQLMRGEIAQFIRLGSSIKTKDPLPDSLRERISIVDVHMAPDLRSAKVSATAFRLQTNRSNESVFPKLQCQSVERSRKGRAGCFQLAMLPFDVGLSWA